MMFRISVLFLFFRISWACLATNGPDSYGDASVYCPPGWVRNLYNRYCYYFNETPMTYDDARDFCINAYSGAQLASIEDRAENFFIFNQLYLTTTGTRPVHYYLGAMTATPGSTPEAFMWIDGKSFGYTNWATGEPDNGGGMDACLVMQIPTTATGPTRDFDRWYDRFCSMMDRSVCKVAATILG